MFVHSTLEQFCESLRLWAYHLSTGDPTDLQSNPTLFYPHALIPFVELDASLYLPILIFILLGDERFAVGPHHVSQWICYFFGDVQYWFYRKPNFMIDFHQCAAHSSIKIWEIVGRCLPQKQRLLNLALNIEINKWLDKVRNWPNIASKNKNIFINIYFLFFIFILFLFLVNEKKTYLDNFSPYIFFPPFSLYLLVDEPGGGGD